LEAQAVLRAVTVGNPQIGACGPNLACEAGAAPKDGTCHSGLAGCSVRVAGGLCVSLVFEKRGTAGLRVDGEPGDAILGGELLGGHQQALLQVF
jgi:hypothetical protein